MSNSAKLKFLFQNTWGMFSSTFFNSKFATNHIIYKFTSSTVRFNESTTRIALYLCKKVVD